MTHSAVFRFSTLLLCIFSGILLASQDWTCADSPFRLHEMSSSSAAVSTASGSSSSSSDAKTDSTTSKQRRMVLIYSTRCGSTTEVANTIAQELKEKGVVTDVYKVEQVPKSLKWADYDGAVLGSCIRMSAWTSEAQEFIQQHKVALASPQLPIATFVSCFTLSEDNETTRKTVAAYPNPVRVHVKEPLMHMDFAGRYSGQDFNFIMRWFLSKIIKTEGDFRNFNTIKSWARDVYSGMQKFWSGERSTTTATTSTTTTTTTSTTVTTTTTSAPASNSKL